MQYDSKPWWNLNPKTVIKLDWNKAININNNDPAKATLLMEYLVNLLIP